MSTFSRSATRGPAVGHPSLEAPFVGRAAELDVLLGALDEAISEGRPRYVSGLADVQAALRLT
jgi:hypothetical protein